ncbi:MAG: ABC transporter permease [Burkholderiaceae bacterium]|nr:ABC transporter permease [Burkholderiaceae bacterium]
MRSSLLRILALIQKEFLAVLKDPRSRFIIFVPPMLQCLIFGYAASLDLNSVPYAVLDQDHSAASFALLARLDGSGVFRRQADLARATDIADWIDSGRALLVIQIDQNFERRLQSGQSAPIEVAADGRNSNTAGTALGYLGSVVERFNNDWQSRHGHASPTVSVVMRAWYNPTLDSRWSMIPSLVGTITMMGTIMLTALSVAREREQGTFDQLLITPFRPSEIMTGKAIPNMIIGLGQSTTILLMAQYWFHIPFQGSFLLLYFGLALFLLAAAGLGLFVSSISATMQQAVLYAFLLMFPFTLLSGLATPFSSMPQVLQSVMVINPLHYALDITKRVYLEDAEFATLIPDFVPLVMIGFFTLFGAAWLFRRRLT